ncbi:NUDIX domain-containing protein [Paenibacillus sp. y28]|uniref:NUDIX domain-containing protein n=1 Tax=Paenibacillus sp. y28 TaxID=3129110 RepID=UPI00301AE1A8
MKLRLIAAAVLMTDQELLMMKRSPSRSLSPGVWAAVGGHMEPGEMASPREAVLREIAEETGIPSSRITGLTLRYILIRQKENEIRQQFMYFGRISRLTLPACDEGTLHWIPFSEVLDREIPFTYRSMLEHYFTHGEAKHVWIGTISQAGSDEDSKPQAFWSPLRDPGVH